MLTTTAPVSRGSIRGARATPDGYVVDSCEEQQQGIDQTWECALSMYSSTGEQEWRLPYASGGDSAPKVEVPNERSIDLQGEAAIVAFRGSLIAADVNTGTALWSSPLTNAATLVPNLATANAAAVVVKDAQANTLQGYDPATGSKLWEVSFPGTLEDVFVSATAALVQANIDGAGAHEVTYVLADGATSFERDEDVRTTTAASKSGFLRYDPDGAVFVDAAGAELWRLDVSARWVGFQDTLVGTVGDQVVILDDATGEQLAYADAPADSNAQADPSALLFSVHGTNEIQGTLAMW